VLQWLRANGCPWDKAACFQRADVASLGLGRIVALHHR
jgi:hypothetical protein